MALPNQEQLLTVRATDRDDAVILTVDGDIDGLTAPRLAAAISSAFERLAGRLLVVDLGGVRFLGSTGLRMLHDSATTAARRDEVLRVVVDRARPVIRPIEIAGLDHVLELYHTVEDATAADDLR